MPSRRKQPGPEEDSQHGQKKVQKPTKLKTAISSGLVPKAVRPFALYCKVTKQSVRTASPAWKKLSDEERQSYRESSKATFEQQMEKSMETGVRTSNLRQAVSVGAAAHCTPAFAFFIKATRESPKVARPLWQKLPLEEKIKYKEMARESSRLEDQERAAGGISIRKDRQRMNEAMNKDEKPARLHEEVAILGKEFGILQDDESTRILGHGSYGTVFLVRQLQSGRLFAAKVETVTKALDSEIEILKDLNHQSILPIFQSQLVRQGFSWFVMPWVQDGSLLRGNALRFKSQRSLFAQMMSGLSYIHSKRIVHADLKPGNILVDTNTEHYYISDFGLAVRLPESPMERFDPGPLYSLPYRPPELLRDDYKNVNILCDSWAIALTIIEAAYGKRFFSAQTDFLTLQKIRKYEQEVGSGMRGDLVVRLKKFMDLVDPSLKKALSKLLSIDQTSRAPCKNYINAACFASVET